MNYPCNIFLKQYDALVAKRPDLSELYIISEQRYTVKTLVAVVRRPPHRGPLTSTRAGHHVRKSRPNERTAGPETFFTFQIRVLQHGEQTQGVRRAGDIGRVAGEGVQPRPVVVREEVVLVREGRKRDKFWCFTHAHAPNQTHEEEEDHDRQSQIWKCGEPSLTLVLLLTVTVEALYDRG